MLSTAAQASTRVKKLVKESTLPTLPQRFSVMNDQVSVLLPDWDCSKGGITEQVSGDITALDWLAKSVGQRTSYFAFTNGASVAVFNLQDINPLNCTEQTRNFCYRKPWDRIARWFAAVSALLKEDVAKAFIDFLRCEWTNETRQYVSLHLSPFSGQPVLESYVKPPPVQHILKSDSDRVYFLVNAQHDLKGVKYLPLFSFTPCPNVTAYTKTNLNHNVHAHIAKNCSSNDLSTLFLALVKEVPDNYECAVDSIVQMGHLNPHRTKKPKLAIPRCYLSWFIHEFEHSEFDASDPPFQCGYEVWGNPGVASSFAQFLQALHQSIDQEIFSVVSMYYELPDDNTKVDMAKKHYQLRATYWLVFNCKAFYGDGDLAKHQKPVFMQRIFSALATWITEDPLMLIWNKLLSKGVAQQPLIVVCMEPNKDPVVYGCDSFFGEGNAVRKSLVTLHTTSHTIIPRSLTFHHNLCHVGDQFDVKRVPKVRVDCKEHEGTEEAGEELNVSSTPAHADVVALCPEKQRIPLAFRLSPEEYSVVENLALSAT